MEKKRKREHRVFINPRLHAQETKKEKERNEES